jgi:uncharacterized protein
VEALPWRIEGKDMVVHVRLTPRAAKEGIGTLWRDENNIAWLGVQVRAVPEKGRANRALIEIMAARLGIAASCIRLDTSRLKRVRIAGKAHEIEPRLKDIFSP